MCEAKIKPSITATCYCKYYYCCYYKYYYSSPPSLSEWSEILFSGCFISKLLYFPSWFLLRWACVPIWNREQGETQIAHGQGDKLECHPPAWVCALDLTPSICVFSPPQAWDIRLTSGPCEDNPCQPMSSHVSPWGMGHACLCSLGMIAYSSESLNKGHKKKHGKYNADINWTSILYWAMFQKYFSYLIPEHQYWDTLQIRKQRQREVEWLSQGHTA